MKPHNIESALEYIKENPGCTVNQLSDYMEKKGKCSRLTTLRIFNEIKESQKVEDRKDKPNGFHRLYINDKNEFNRIKKQLLEIEIFIDEMSVPIRDYKNGRILISREDDDLFFLHYHDYCVMILHVLLVRVNKLIHSQNDAELIYTRIVELIIKLNKQGVYQLDMDQFNNHFNIMKEFTSVRHLDINDPRKIRLIRIIKTKLKNLDKQFPLKK